MASRGDRNRSHGNDGKLRKSSNPTAGSEFIQRYSKEEYSRALPLNIVPKTKPRLGEYCVPVDSKPVQKQKSLDRLDFTQDPDHGYALPQDSLIGSTSSSASQNDEVDGLVYELAQQPPQEFHTSPPAKPMPMPRTTVKENDKSPQHNPVSKSTHQHPKIIDDVPDSSASEYNLASACFTESSEVTPSDRRRPSRKVVEIEYEAVSDLRPYRPYGSQIMQRTSSLETADQTANMNNLITVTGDSSPHHSVSGSPQATPTSYNPALQQETVYEEPWDLKAKRLKEEKEQKEKERKLSLVRVESQNAPDMRSDVYEEAWDTAAQQKKLEQKFKLARTISQTSEGGDVYHDAFDNLPADAKTDLAKKDSVQIHKESKKESHFQKSSPSKHDSPLRQQSTASHASSHHRYSQSQSRPDKPPPPPENPPPPAPISYDTYEDAWDLKKSALDEQIRKMQMQTSATYEEPWENSKHHKDIQAQFNRSQSTASERPITTVPRSSSDARDHTSSANAARSYMKGRHNSTDDARLKYKVRGPNIGQRINPLIPLTHQNWFHGNISRDDAEQMLCVCKEGSYIVRISSDRKSYSLSIKSAKQYIHVQIEQVAQPDGSWRFILGKNSKEFCTIPEMIDHYTHHRVPLKGAEHITLLHPVECKWSQQS